MYCPSLDSSEESFSSEKLDSSEELDASEEQPVKKNRKKDAPKEVRNWIELPPDVMSLIFLKLGAIEILLSAQSVCSTWRKLSKEPQLFRSVDMENRWDLLYRGVIDMEKIARESIDRSCGQLVEFCVELFGTDELLQYITDKSSPLKRIRLVSCYDLSDDGLMEMAKKLPMLEELEICHCKFSDEAIAVVGQACPLLKSFRLNCQGFRHTRMEYDEEALAIAKHMPELRHLHLVGNRMTNIGLRAILDGCPHLESLDLRQCFNINLVGEREMLKRCKDGIRNFHWSVTVGTVCGTVK